MSSISRQVTLAIAGIFLGCTAVALFSAHVLLKPEWTHGDADFPSSLLLQAWAHWDAGWYAQIVRDGYWFKGPDVQSPVAFFPLYPLGIRALTEIGINRYWGGVFLTAASGLLALWLFSRWATRTADERSALHGTLFFALYPFTFYLYGPIYSDAAFVMLAIAAFLCLERGNLVAATVLGALATAARPVAPAIIVGLVARRIELKRRAGEPLRPLDFLPVLAATGMLLYMLFLWREFGEPFAFARVQGAAGWDQAPGWNTWLKTHLFERLMYDIDRNFALTRLTHAVMTTLGLALVIPTWKRLGWAYGLYTLMVLAIPAVSSKDFMGLGRYALAAFPIFLTVALVLRERPRWRMAVLGGSASALAIFTALFAAGFYVA